MPRPDAAAPPKRGPVGQAMHDKLVDQFAPAVLQVIDESHGHSGNRVESHFKVVVVGDAFAGMSLVKRHRAINGLLAAELAAGVHALSIFAYTPEQWRSRDGEMPASPPCRGGG